MPFLGRIPLAPEVVALADQGQSLLTPAAPEAARVAFSGIAGKLLAR